MLRKRENGFTLVEVLVALVVTALLLTVILDGATTARDRQFRALQQRRAVLLAASLLQHARVAPAASKSTNGETNGLKWTLTENVDAVDPRSGATLTTISTEIFTKTGRRVAAFSAKSRRTVVPQ